MRTIHQYNRIDVPSTEIGKCFYCGDPFYCYDHFPPVSRVDDHRAVYGDSHPLLLIPSCKQCNGLLLDSIQPNWSFRRIELKKKLGKKLDKFLNIGINWSEAELKDSDFSGQILGGFRLHAWDMYQDAKARMDYAGWAVAVDQTAIDVDMTKIYVVAGRMFTTIDDLIDFCHKKYHVSRYVFAEVLGLYGYSRLDSALAVCKVVKPKSKEELDQLKADITLQLLEEDGQI